MFSPSRSFPSPFSSFRREGGRFQSEWRGGRRGRDEQQEVRAQRIHENESEQQGVKKGRRMMLRRAEGGEINLGISSGHAVTVGSSYTVYVGV